MVSDLFLRKSANDAKGPLPRGVSGHRHYHIAECLTSFPVADTEQQQRGGRGR